MTPWIEPIAVWLADFFLAATVLLAGAAVVFAIDRQPARRMAVGWGTLLSVLLVVALCLSASYPRLRLRSLSPSRNEVAADPKPIPSSLPSVQSSTPLTSNGVGEFAHAHPPGIAAEHSHAIVSRLGGPKSNGPVRALRGEPLVTVVVCIYLVGMLLVGIRLSLGALRAFQLVRQSTPAPDACVDALLAIAGRSSRLPRLLVNRSLFTPVATGTLHPVILLPERLTQSSSPQELKAVLLHEWAHIKNGDLWLLSLSRFLLYLLWPHPLYLWMRHRLRTDQEFLADAAAASQVGATDYAALLVEWARLRGQIPRLPALGIRERGASLTQRITAILNQSDRMMLRCSGGARAFALLGLPALSALAATISLRPPMAESAQPEAKSNPAAARSELSPADMLFPAAVEISGICVDSRKKPVAGAEVFLYAVNWQVMTQRLAEQTLTDARGRFQFTRLAPKVRTGENDIVVARRVGLATSVTYVAARGKGMEILMPKAATFRGTVRDPKGKPLAGAQVSFASNGVNYFVRPVEGICCARTKAKGEFSVDDLCEFTYVRQEVPPGWRGVWGTMGPPSMMIFHPDYVRTWAEYRQVPGNVDVVLSDPAAGIFGTVVGETGRPAAGVSVAVLSEQPGRIDRDVAETGPNGSYRFASLPQGSFSLWVSSAPGDQTSLPIESVKTQLGQITQAPLMRLLEGGVINGQVLDDIRRRPVAGITVALQGIWEQQANARGIYKSTKTDGQGKYRFAGLRGGKFNIFIDDTGPDATAAAIDSLQVECGKTATAPPLRLIRGGGVKGRVIDDATGKPIVLRNDEKLDVRIYGPTRPRSGAACHSAKVRKDGTFEIRLPPGITSLLLETGQAFNPTGEFSGDISVPDGGEVRVEYHVTRFEPLKAGRID